MATHKSIIKKLAHKLMESNDPSIVDIKRRMIKAEITKLKLT